MVIGLTGGIASGKSTVSTMLRDLDIPVVDADLIAREVVEVGEEAYEKIVELFGNDVLAADRTLDRKKLGAIIFTDEKERQKLNNIVHPAVRKKMTDDLQKYKNLGHETIVLDIPLLFESNLTHMVEKVILVYVDIEQQTERLKKRDQFSLEEASARIAAQMPLKDKIKLADAVIDNNNSKEATKDQLVTILKTWNVI